MIKNVNIYEGIYKARFKTITVDYVSTKVRGKGTEISIRLAGSYYVVASVPIEAYLEGPHPYKFSTL
jgi:hypothetical protein